MVETKREERRAGEGLRRLDIVRSELSDSLTVRASDEDSCKDNGVDVDIWVTERGAEKVKMLTMVGWCAYVSWTHH
jgi:hypothetical protein